MPRIDEPDAVRPIGVFDSGVGGLTVARALRRRAPDEPILYLGDTARVPYGNRSEATVRRYALGAARFLVERGVKALVIACNTATAFGLEALQDAYPALPIVGVIDPLARLAARRTETGHIGVIGTRGTVQSARYAELIARIDPRLRVHALACPLFVPLAEEGWVDDELTRQIARRYLAPFADRPIDALLLGCTHYPLLRPAIGPVLDDLCRRHVALLDAGAATAEALCALLDERGLAATSPLKTAPPIELKMTDTASAFLATAHRFFGGPIGRPEIVDLDLGAWTKP